MFEPSDVDERVQLAPTPPSAGVEALTGRRTPGKTMVLPIRGRDARDPDQHRGGRGLDGGRHASEREHDSATRGRRGATSAEADAEVAAPVPRARCSGAA